MNRSLHVPLAYLFLPRALNVVGRRRHPLDARAAKQHLPAGDMAIRHQDIGNALGQAWIW